MASNNVIFAVLKVRERQHWPLQLSKKVGFFTSNYSFVTE
jgi:hypothetical protein